MSSNSVRSRMSGFLRKVFGKSGEAEAEIQAAPAPAAAPLARSTPSPATPVHRNGTGHSKGIELPLQAILAGLPLELQPKLKHSYSGALTVSIPLEKIL